MSFVHRMLGMALLFCPLLGQPQAERPSMFAGTHFLVGFLQNEIERGSSLRLQLSIAARRSTTVWVHLPTEPQPRQYRLSAGGYAWIAVPPAAEVRTPERPVRAAVEIRSDAPIVVYAFNSQWTTTDAYTAIPVTNWGTAYVVASFPNDAYTPRPGDTTANRLRDLTLRRSQWMVVAAYDSTVVTFTPSVQTSGGKAAGIPHTVVLNRGECYLVQSDSTPRGLGDMTGTLVQSSKPIGLLSGHVRTSLPQQLSAEADTKDHLVEMLPPVPALGKRYITTPFAIGTGDWFRAIAVFPQTRIRLSRATTGQVVETVLSQRGEVADFPAEASPLLWEADKPFLLVQLMYSAVLGGPRALTDPYVSFDPSMVIVPPEEQYIQQAHFFVPDTSLGGFSQFKRHWANLVVSASAVRSLRLNGIPITQVAPELSTRRLPWTSSEGEPYHWIALPVEPGRVYELHTPTGVFTGILYGTGYVDSYALVLGSGLLPAGSKDTVPPKVLLQAEPCGMVELRASDSSSGIAWIEPLADSTWNYTWDYQQLNRWEALMRAHPIEPAQDGQLMAEVRTNAGVRQWVRHRYWAPRLEPHPAMLQFPGILLGTTQCQSITLTNTGADTLHLVQLSTRDRRLALYDILLPLTLPPGSSATLRVCFRAEEARPLRDTLWLHTMCTVSFAIPLEGSVDSVGLRAQGCSAGVLLVGEERACIAQWINTSTRPLQVLAARASRGERAFALDTAGLFPTVLAPGDTLSLPIRFRPYQRGQFWEEIELQTVPPASASARIEGRGIAPAVTDVTLDWRRRRIGLRYDSTVVLVNTGDAPTDVHLVADSGSSPLGHAIPQRFRLREGDTLYAAAWFAPLDRQRYERRLTLQSSWTLHPPITVTLLGEGSAPEVHPEAVDFDTVLVGRSRDSLALVARCAGNEETLLDTLWLEGPDRTAFELTTMPTLPQRFAPGEALWLRVRFFPQRPGPHVAWIVLHHNGKPPSLTDTVHVPLQGYGLAAPPVDTAVVRWEARSVLPSTAVACTEVQGQLCVWNRGNTLLIADSLMLYGASFWMLEQSFPITIAPADSMCLRFSLAGLPAGRTAITLRLALHSEYTFADTVRILPLVWEEHLSLSAFPQQWSIEELDTLALSPGERSVLHISGRLPSTNGIGAGGTVCVTIPPQVWSLEAAEYVVEHDGQSHWTYLAERREHPWGFCFYIPSVAIGADSPARWQLRIPVQAFLGREQRYELAVATHPDSLTCFQGDSTTGEVLLSGLCAPRIRSIRLQQNPAIALGQLWPQPASDFFFVELQSSIPTVARIQLLTLHGDIVAEWGEQLPEGTALRKFEVTNLPAGVYCFRLLTPVGRQQRLLVIQ